MKSNRWSILAITSKSFRYTFNDKRKLLSLFIVLSLPLIGNAWRFVPDEMTFPYYDYLNIFVFQFGLSLITFMIAIAWFLTIPRRDFALQIIAMSGIFYGLFMAYDTLPFTEKTPLWLDVLVSLAIFIIVCFYLYYIHRNYINRKIDHKQLYDGMVHDLHHEKLLNSVSRVEGLIDVAELEEPYRSICREEIAKIRDAVSYVSEKYSELK